MKLGSLIIYDNNGSIWVNTGDCEGDVKPYTIPEGLPYIITRFGELNNKIVIGVNVKTKELITQDIPRIETEEEILRKENKKLENQLLDTQEKIVNDKYNKLIQK